MRCRDHTEAMAFPCDSTCITVQNQSRRISQNICVRPSHTHTHSNTHSNTNTVNHSCFLWWNERLSFVPETQTRAALPPKHPTLPSSDHRPARSPLTQLQLLSPTSSLSPLLVSNRPGHTGSCSLWPRRERGFWGNSVNVWKQLQHKPWGNEPTADVPERGGTLQARSLKYNRPSFYQLQRLMCTNSQKQILIWIYTNFEKLILHDKFFIRHEMVSGITPCIYSLTHLPQTPRAVLQLHFVSHSYSSVVSVSYNYFFFFFN